MIEVTDMAQKRLGVDCMSGNGAAMIRYVVGVRCTRANGVVILKGRANKKTFKKAWTHP